MGLDKKGLEGLFREMGSFIYSKIRIAIMGKAYMVLEGFFPSTESLDCILISKKEMEDFESCVASFKYRRGEVSQEYKDFSMVAIYHGPINISIFLLDKIGKGIQAKSKAVGRYGKLEVSIINQDDILELLKI